MTYQVLARKWRPQDFAGLVGQQHVVTALGNALAENRIAQAYLFSGIRGVGKTTAARVLAKALNCERGPAANPCNECTSCVEITSGHSLDVIEVDAATYSKVEQVRELTETLRYGPARGRYKVVVLDEVHRLSRQAFDALLKIVEEPPAHLVFIFATTEIDAVPATILSRCQEFQFRRVTQPVLAAHLRQISEAEDIIASDAALHMIARAGEGSVRDSVALLDQMATFGSGTISDEDAQSILGGLDTAIFQKLLAALLHGDRAEIVRTVREIEANGWDPHNVYAQFLVFLRHALHLTLDGVQEGGDLTGEEAELIRQTVAGHGYESLLQILQLLISSEPTVRRSEFSLLALEIAWLRAAELPKVTRLQDLLSGGAPTAGGAPPTPSSGRRSGGGRASGGGQGSGGGRASGNAERSASAHAAAPRSIAGRVQEPVRERDEAVDAAPVEEHGLGNCDPMRLPELLELLSNRRQSLAAHFEHAELHFERRTLLISPPAGDSLFTRALERQSNQETLAKALSEIWGAGVSWRLHGSMSTERSLPHPAERSRAPDRPEAVRPIEKPANSRPSFPQGPPASFHQGLPASSFEPVGPQPDWTSPDWSSPERPRSNGGARITPEQAAAVAELPVVRTILSTFGGKIQSVEPVSEESPP